MIHGQQVLIWDLSMIDLGYDSPILGTIVSMNGDQVDVADPDGEVDCFPVEWCWAQMRDVFESEVKLDEALRDEGIDADAAITRMKAAIEQADKDVPATAIDVTCVVKLPRHLEGFFARKVRKAAENCLGHVLRLDTPDEVALTRELDELREKIRAYDVGDRPQSPPARFLVRENELRKELQTIWDRRT